MLEQLQMTLNQGELNKTEEYGETSLRQMSMQQRAVLGKERIIRLGARSTLTDDEWQALVVEEFERLQQEVVESCAMLLEQDMPLHVEHPNIEIIGKATGNYLRCNMSSVVAHVEIEEDGSVDLFSPLES